MKNIIHPIFILIILVSGINISMFAQPAPYIQEKVDSLEQALRISDRDISRVNCLNALAEMYMLNDLAKSFSLCESAQSLADSLDYKRGLIKAMSSIAFIQCISGELMKSTEITFKGLELAEEFAPDFRIRFYSIKAMIHEYQNEYEKAIEWLHKGLNDPYFKKSKELHGRWGTYFMLGSMYQLTGVLDSALYYSNIAYDMVKEGDWVMFSSRPISILAQIDKGNGDYDAAIKKLHQAISILSEYHQDFATFELLYMLADVFDASGQGDSAIYYGKQVYEGGKRFENFKLIENSASLLAKNYALTNKSDAFDYLSISNAYKDSIAAASKVKQMEELEYNERKRIEDIENAKITARNQIRQNALLGTSTTLLIVAFLFWGNNRTKKRSNKLLQEQKEEVEKTLDQLKSTQSQLIQSEKMASLGELTAGIAHEIQNPLNFVNNFSEVSEELVIELKEELEKGEVEEAKEISNDVIENLKKINHHGHRASGIVKGMLEHSRTGDGVKESTDLNAMADEYLRLVYHGLRAKDKALNADFNLELDENLPKIQVIPQDIGRVLLNLINNAFYASSSKALASEDIDYKPLVSIRTKKFDSKIEISVKDNGEGIPEQVRDKIFQPFFTTKPTGEGTGLGLSLSYDIIKAHKGNLNLKSDVGIGTEFIIELPIN